MSDLVEGWKCIAAELGVNEATVRRWAGRTRDPLPILRHTLSGRVAAERPTLEAWRRRQWRAAREH